MERVQKQVDENRITLEIEQKKMEHVERKKEQARRSQLVKQEVKRTQDNVIVEESDSSQSLSDSDSVSMASQQELTTQNRTTSTMSNSKKEHSIKMPY